jgi:hypothetical protein
MSQNCFTLCRNSVVLKEMKYYLFLMILLLHEISDLFSLAHLAGVRAFLLFEPPPPPPFKSARCSCCKMRWFLQPHFLALGVNLSDAAKDVRISRSAPAR